jgi:hypothetical protein
VNSGSLPERLFRIVSFWEIAMTKVGRSKAHRRRVPAIATLVALFAATQACLAYDGPTFRQGLWKFERTLETNGETTNRLQTSGISIAREMTRCVNPTQAMKAEFTPFGACEPKNFRKTDGGYVFQKFCGGGTPIKTEIDVESDSAYKLINEGDIGKMSTKETVVAHRVGDCRNRGS